MHLRLLNFKLQNSKKHANTRTGIHVITESTLEKYALLR